MNPFQANIDASFGVLGLEGVLEQGDLTRAVRVLPFEEDDFAEFGDTRVKSRGGAYEIRATDFAGFTNGAVLTIGNERRRVQSNDTLDRLRLKRVLKTVPA